MKKALIVAYYFPPMLTSGAMRPLAFCRHLPAFGWAPRVIAADPRSVVPPVPADHELAARILPGIRVDRIGHRNPLETAIRLRDRLWPRTTGRRAQRVAPPAGADRAADRSLAGSLKELVLEHTFHIPDVQQWWYRRAVRCGARGDRPDVVFATGSPWTALLVGRALARHFQVPFIADFRDPWTRNPFRTYSPSAWRRSRRLERSVCRAAARVVLNTVELRDQFATDYPDLTDNFVAIPNGFDSTAFAEADQPARALEGVRDDPAPALDLWHFGTVYGRRSPLALLTAIDMLLADGRIRAGSLRVRFVGRWEGDDHNPATRLARKLEGLGVVSREPAVPHQTCVALMRRAQALLVLQPDSPLQVPGKIYEYIATGRPLLVIGGEGATTALVNRHRLGRCCLNQVEPIHRLLAELTSGAGLAPPPAGEMDRFDYRRLTGQLAELFAETSCSGARAIPAVAF